MKIQLQLVLLVSIAGALAIRREKPMLTIKSVECEINPIFGQNAICKFKPIRNMLGSIHLGGILNVTLEKMNIGVHQYIKNSANTYRKGPVQFTEDLCKLNANADGMLFKFLPILKEYGEKLKIIHPCPYYPEIFDFGVIEVPNIEQNMLAAVYPSGDYKVIFRISDSKNVTIYQNTVTSFFRGSNFFSKM